MEQLAKRIYEGEEITSDRQLLRSTAQDLLKGVQKGYGKREIDWNSPDADMIQNLTENVYQFAAAKNYHELRDMTDAVHDGDKVRSFDEFEKEVKDITGKYNRSWLRSEYNQAIAASQSAARWGDYQRNAKDMPFLQYQCVMDDNTRPEHASLHGIIKRIDDPFWDEFMPPNGWGCRCEAIQLPGSNYEETPDKDIHPAGVPDMFRTNFGKKGIVFPPGHAYYKGMPDEVWEKCTIEAQHARIDQIKHEARLKLLDTRVKVPGYDKEIGFTGKIIKEYLNQPYIDYMTKNEALLTMDKRLEASTYLGELKKKQPDLQYETHAFETEMKGRKAWLLVRKYDNVANATFYSISDCENILKYLIKR